VFTVAEGKKMTVFKIVDPADLAEFCKSIAQTGMGEAKREAIERAYALALYSMAQRRDKMKIDGALAIEYTQWLLN
jgi:hypothetical protein